MTATLTPTGTLEPIDLPPLNWTPEERRAKLAPGIEELVPVALASYLSQDWLTFGFKTWEEYVESVTGGVRLPRAKRRKVALDLKTKSMSNRAIAAIVGASEVTVRRDLAEATATNDAVDLPETVTSIDGRKRPTRPIPKGGGHAETAPTIIDVEPTPEAIKDPKAKKAADRKKATGICRDFGKLAAERFAEEGLDPRDHVTQGVWGAFVQALVSPNKGASE